MSFVPRLLSILIAVLAVVLAARGQDEEICADRGIVQGLAANTQSRQVIFGRVSVKRAKGGAKPPRLVISLRDGRNTQRWVIEGSGTYCFEKSNFGGEITVDFNGQEVGRRPIITNLPQQREDFDFDLRPLKKPDPPGVVSATLAYERHGKNAKLFAKASDEIAEGNVEKAIQYLSDLVENDPGDFVALATIGSLYKSQKKYSEAEVWYKRAIAVNSEFTPAWITLAQAQFAQEKYELAIDSCKTATKLDPNSAVGFYLLGEAYLRLRQGEDAVRALKEAIRLDPIAMAECHLILAELYDINGAKQLASKEYKEFLTRVPNHPQKEWFEQYIKDNP